MHNNSDLWRESLKKRKYWLDAELEILKQSPEKSAKELAAVLERSEYQVARVDETSGVVLLGGQSEVDKFLSKVDCVIIRKKFKIIVEK
jgi:hypothetical protein